MTDSEEFARFSGGTGNQFSSLLKMSPSNASFKPQPSRKQKRGYVFDMPNMPKFNAPNINVGAIINLGILAAVGIVGYKLYNKFFGGASAVVDEIKDKGEKAAANLYVNNGQAKADTVAATAASLNAKGLNVSTMHQSLANTYHEYFDHAFPNHDKILKTIKGQNIQTFRLVSVAYGARTIKSYLDYSVLNFFQDHLTPYTFKDTLQMILSESELSSISGYIAVI